ncbi:hypothetical protein C3F09_09940 [candidate division GN15 bacterium]|uniref:Secretion system C-terminal sorting domain-containing protein n=1 Tax=candidate division GN15 bacterium TaxID=2072418 RepID=A0A855X4J0_9BACT|nr:MAG: hypothetical protein C3F09_09940 [candidate division GN15 bacterium]
MQPWSIVAGAEAVIPDTLHVLVLRYNFQFETTDNPNTTGRGRMDLTRITDSAAYYAAVGHWIDPPPHNAAYFDAHMQALNRYWHQVSEQKLNLVWDIYPQATDSVYQLPHDMAYYGKCSFDSVVYGLENYFTDCVKLADTVDPGIDFGRYQAIILFHAGSDRQNDIGFPPTCSDLFTGYIRFGDSIAVDNGARYLRTAIMMPETACQDNRATALNAVLAHEFGHAIGLVDLYSTNNFMSQLGDFSLMDDNGFGTGIDYGFAVGQVFGAIPVYPDAWSRAYLGLTPVRDFRQGTDISLLAAEVTTHNDKIARLPISENEFYLLENRNIDIDGTEAVTIADSATGVILGPGRVFVNGTDTTLVPTGEYDFLLPGSGMLIYQVDEGVAGLDYDGDGVNNFEDNQLQNDPNRRFIKLIEADGIVHFGGYYRSGYGEPGDMFRDDRAHAFTPNTNPQALDNSGNNTHIYVTDIRRDTVRAPGAREVTYLDSLMRFNVETDKMAAGFPVRAGQPTYGLSPIADDLDRDGTDEIIAASGRDLLVITGTGENFLRTATHCSSCPLFIDTARSTTSPGEPHAIPLFFRAPEIITCGPVTGDFGDTLNPRYVAIGWPNQAVPGAGIVNLYATSDLDQSGQADPSGFGLATQGVPIALSFGDVLWSLTGAGYVYRMTPDRTSEFHLGAADTLFHGICRIGDGLIVMTGDSTDTRLYYLSYDVSGDSLVAYSYPLGGYYSLGPITVDLTRQRIPGVCAFSTDGRGIFVEVDTATAQPNFRVVSSRSTGYKFTVNPVAGDVDNDSRAEFVIGGQDAVYAFTQDFLLKNDFPIEVDDRYPATDIVAALVMGEIDGVGHSEMVFPSDNGNIYSFGHTRTAGFPLPGGEKGAGSCLIFHDSLGAKLAYLGIDGWFYAWDVAQVRSGLYWPMGGHDPIGSFAFPDSALPPPVMYEGESSIAQFFNYPNPVMNGQTAFRYSLGPGAGNVTLSIYDLSGERVAQLDGTSSFGENEVMWSCDRVTPGIYRCLLKVEYNDGTKTRFTDVAIIR